MPFHGRDEPVPSIVCYASSADIDAILIAGWPVLCAGKAPRLDETAIVRQGSAAASLLRGMAKQCGYFPDRMEPPKR